MVLAFLEVSLIGECHYDVDNLTSSHWLVLFTGTPENATEVTYSYIAGRQQRSTVGDRSCLGRSYRE